MSTPNKALMTEAREALSGKWAMAVGTFFVYFIIVMSISMFTTAWDLITGALTAGTPSQFSPISSLITIIIGGPFALGAVIFTLNIAKKDGSEKMENIFWGFKRFGKALLTYVLMIIFVLLWTLLLIIPGIIAAFAYSMVFYIIAEDEEISAMDALKKSRAMMDGYKWKFFFLSLRFIGWGLLCILTLGIGYFWLLPYMQVAIANFYLDVKADYLTKTAGQEL